jgi:hypothetical protein
MLTAVARLLLAGYVPVIRLCLTADGLLASIFGPPAAPGHRRHRRYFLTGDGIGRFFANFYLWN